MANILNTRIRLKYDTLANWSSNNPTLLEGELAIVSIPSGVTQEVNSVSAPQILFKVGPGEFNSLPYASGKAADVYTWAKLAGADVFKKDGNGNVVSGIEYDATANDGKGGFKFTTASVATSEGLQALNNAVAELAEEVYGENGSANASRIDALEQAAEDTNAALDAITTELYGSLVDSEKSSRISELEARMTAEENKVDNDTTYTFAKTEKGFSVTPKGGEAQTITFEYLTEAQIKEVVEEYGYATAEALNNVDAKFASYRTSEAQDAIDATFATKEDVAGIESEGTVVVAIRTASGDIIGNGETFQMITDHDISIKSVDEGSVDIEGGYVGVSADRVNITGDVTISGYRTSEAQDAIDATFATKTELSGVDGRVSTLEGGVANWNDKYTKEEIDGKVNAINGTLATKADASSLNNYYTKEETYNSTTIDSKIEAAEGRANGYADKAVSDFKDFLLGNGATDAIDTIKDLSDALASHEDAYDALLETVGKKAEKTYVDEEIGKVSKSVTDLGTSTDTRLDAIEAQLGLGGGDSDTGSVTEQLAAHTLVLGDHESRIAANEGAIKALNETTVPGLEGRIGANETAIKTINETTIPGLDSRIKTLEDNPYELPSDVVQDADYKHIRVTETSVSDGTTTFTKYDDTELAGKVDTINTNLVNAFGLTDTGAEYIGLTVDGNPYGLIEAQDSQTGLYGLCIHPVLKDENVNLRALGNGGVTVTANYFEVDATRWGDNNLINLHANEISLAGTVKSDSITTQINDAVKVVTDRLDGVNSFGSVEENFERLNGEVSSLYGEIGRVEENIHAALDGDGSDLGIYGRLDNAENDIESINGALDTVNVELYGASDNPGLVQRVETIEAKKVVEYYESEQPDYTKDMFVICCGSSSDLI